MGDSHYPFSRLNDHMANERTFLAWIRTSIGMMALGFVVGKFALFITEMRGLPEPSQTAPQAYPTALIFGLLIVAFGALTCLLSFIKYKKVAGQIERGAYTPSTRLELTMTVVVLAIGMGLVVYFSQGLVN